MSEKCLYYCDWWVGHAGSSVLSSVVWANHIYSVHEGCNDLLQQKLRMWWDYLKFIQKNTFHSFQRYHQWKAASLSSHLPIYIHVYIFVFQFQLNTIIQTWTCNKYGHTTYIYLLAVFPPFYPTMSLTSYKAFQNVCLQHRFDLCFWLHLPNNVNGSFFFNWLRFLRCKSKLQWLQ